MEISNFSVDQMDSLNNMPTLIDESVWISLCKLRRVKIENEIKVSRKYNYLNLRINFHFKNVENQTRELKIYIINITDACSFC